MSERIREHLPGALSDQCPLQIDADQAIHHSRELLAALRRLQRSRKVCQLCAGLERCPLVDQYNLLVQQAVQEVVEEWNRSHA